jgi:L-lactate dehydrogenase complex protein LldG
MSAREEIMRSIRDGLARSAEIEARHPLQVATPPKRRPTGIALPIVDGNGAAAEPGAPAAAPTSPLAAFRARMEAVGGRVAEVADEAEAAALIAAVLAELGARSLAVTDSPLAQRIAARARELGDAELVPDPPTDQLFHCDAGITEAQWGIAETGTLVLASAHERNRLASLVPPVHVALLSAGHILDTIGDALAAAREPVGGVPSHVITFITGPSRTSDIELTLAIGVHGPQVLLVVILP